MTKRGLSDIWRVGVPDGLLYFGVDGLWAITKEYLQRIDPVCSAIAIPQKGIYMQKDGY